MRTGEKLLEKKTNHYNDSVNFLFIECVSSGFWEKL